MNDLKEALEKIIAVPIGYHAAAKMEAIARAALAAQPPAAPVEAGDGARNANSTLWGQIAAVYGNLDAEDCALVDREWAKWRGIAHKDADEYEKRIREKVWASGCLSAGEWVYLVGVFQSVKDAEEQTPHSRSSAESAGLANLILEYAKDLRRNSSGGDDYPWAWAKGAADYLEELVRRANLVARRDKIAAGAFYKTRGDKNNLPHIVGPLERADDGDAPWQARVHDQIWKWGYDGLANTDGSPHNRDLMERVYRPECLPGEPQPTQVSAERIASMLALSYGRDPDDLTHMTEMCDAENRPVPIWRVYEEQAEALLDVYSIAEKVLLAQPQEVSQSPEFKRLVDKADEQTTALDQIMTTAADNLAAPNSDLKMTLEFIHHVAEYTLSLSRPHGGGK